MSDYKPTDKPITWVYRAGDDSIDLVATYTGYFEEEPSAAGHTILAELDGIRSVKSRQVAALALAIARHTK